MDNSTLIVIVAVGVVVAAGIALGAALFVRQRRSRHLREQYGTEYATTVGQVGDRHKAEAELRRREARVGKLDIRPLTPIEADRYGARWRKAQADFVDSPGAAIAYADDLLGEVMIARGYPMADFERRAADLSVDHPALVSNYRLAHEVAVRHGRGEADTEELRRAMIHYRDLFADLVAPTAAEPASGEPRSFRDDPAPIARAESETETDRRRDVRDDRDRLDGRSPLA